MPKSSGGGSSQMLLMDKDTYIKKVNNLKELKGEIDADGSGDFSVGESTSASIDLFVQRYSDIQGLMSNFGTSIDNLTEALESAYDQLTIIDGDIIYDC